MVVRTRVLRETCSGRPESGLCFLMVPVWLLHCSGYSDCCGTGCRQTFVHVLTRFCKTITVKLAYSVFIGPRCWLRKRTLKHRL